MIKIINNESIKSFERHLTEFLFHHKDNGKITHPIKKLLIKRKIKMYQKKMKQENFCEQCVNPWNDGLCECGKISNNELISLHNLIN